MNQIQSFVALIEAFGQPADLARALGVDPGLVRIWKHRDSIPAAYWVRVVSAFAEQGSVSVSLDVLAGLASRQPTQDAA